MLELTKWHLQPRKRNNIFESASEISIHLGKKKIPKQLWLMASEDCGSCVGGTQIAIKLIAQEAALKMGWIHGLRFVERRHGL